MADFVRRDIWALEEEAGAWHPITEAYARAVSVMQARGAEQPTSWAYQAAVHGAPPGLPRDQFVDQCQHNTWFFLPWHRMYLYWFERIVRATLQEIEDVPDEVRSSWALPYWNYGRGGDTAALPPAFLEPTLADGETANPLFTELRDPTIAAGGELHPLAVSAARALAEASFAQDPIPGGTVGFGGPVTGWNHFDESADAAPGALEQTPHNVVHGGVGGARGLMSAFDTAPLDPVFWMHHANIDRLWADWLKQDGRENPAETAWADEPFDFHDEDGNPVRMTSSEVVDPGELDYEYEEVAVPAPAGGGGGGGVPPRQPPPDRPPELVGATDAPLTLEGRAEQVAIPLSEPAGPALLAGESEPGRVYVNVEGIKGKQNPGLSYAVYVNLPDDQDPDTAERHHVGNLSFFGIERAQDVDVDHPGGHGLRYVFDITELANELRQQGHWDPAQVTVSFDPIGPQPPPGQAEAAGAAAAVPPVQIGRVGIYYQ
jgi:tyrosinase